MEHLKKKKTSVGLLWLNFYNVHERVLKKKKKIKCKAYLITTEITEKEIYETLTSMENDETPVSNRLSKDFYEVFWDDIKIPLLELTKDAFIKEELKTSQNFTIIEVN